MALSSFIYNQAKTMGMSITAGYDNLCYWSSVNASYYITLLSNNYVPAESHQYASAFSGAELGAASFTSGFNGTIRISLTGRALNVNNVSNQVEFQCNTVTWSAIAAANGTAHAFIVLQQTGSDGTSPLVTYNSLGGFPITMNGTTFTLSFTSAGVFDGIDASA